MKAWNMCRETCLIIYRLVVRCSCCVLHYMSIFCNCKVVFCKFLIFVKIPQNNSKMRYHKAGKALEIQGIRIPKKLQYS